MVDGYQVVYDIHGVAHAIRGLSFNNKRYSVLTTCQYDLRACGEPAYLARKGSVTCMQCINDEVEEFLDG